MKTLKLLIVSPLPPPYGGIARWSEQVINYLELHNCIKFSHLDIAVRWRSVHSNFLFRVLGGFFQLVFNYLSFIVNLIKGYNVIHLTSSGSIGLFRDILFALTCNIFNVHFILHIRFGRIPEIYKKRSYEYYLIIFLFKLCDDIICIDDRSYQFLNNLNFNNIHLIPNCIDYSFGADQGCFFGRENIINFVGWVKKEKGVDELIASFINLNPVDWKLNIIGPIDNNFYSELLCKYDLEKYNDKIKFVGQVDNINILPMLKKSKIFILPSYTEGFPNVILEAMACKNAVISTSVGAIPEILSNNCGILVNPTDQKSLEQEMNLLLNSPYLQLELSNNAFLRCKNHYSIDNSVTQYLKIWRNEI